MNRELREVRVGDLKPNPRNTNRHPKKQIKAIARSMHKLGYGSPIVVDEDLQILAGHARREAAVLLGWETISVIVLSGLGEAQKRALLIADNKSHDKSAHDRAHLHQELIELEPLLDEIGLDLSITFVEPPELDQLNADFGAETVPADEFQQCHFGPPVTIRGDIWLIGKHRLVCGDARSSEDVDALMQGRKAAMAFLDPPYNRKASSIGGRGRHKHDDFAMASGEMSASEYTAFLQATIANAARVSQDGAAHYLCHDWRNLAEVNEACTRVYGPRLNLVVWVKSGAAQGGFYRGQHELISVFKTGLRKTSQQRPARSSRAQSKQCVAIPWRQHFPQRSDRRASISSNPETDQSGRRCDEGLHAARRYRARSLRWLWHHHPGG